MARTQFLAQWAHVERAKEQIIKVRNEMQRLPHSYMHEAHRWEARLQHGHLSAGHRIYIHAQHAFWLKKARGARKEIFTRLLAAPPPLELSSHLLYDPKFDLGMFE